MVLFVRTMHTSHLVPVLRRSAKMFWVLLTLSLALADKLDRTYLPPSGSKFSGGSPGAIQVPLQYPKLPSSTKDNNSPRPEIAIGIDRVAPNQISNSYDGNIPSTYLDTFNTLPTTVFPQTTTQSLQTNFDDGSSNFPVNDFSDAKVYPQQIQGGNILNTPISYANQDYSSTSTPVNIDLQTGTLDSLDRDVIACNNSSPSDFLDNQYNPCTAYKEKQYYSTVAPSSINSNNGIQHFYSTVPTQFSTTTKSPLNKGSYDYNFDNKRPERIQAQADREAVILNYENALTPDGYAYNFDTSNGIHGDESGIILDGVKAKGSYSYIGDDGKLYKVVYTADENGFQPQGDHLPTAPPIPDAILKVIEKAYEDKKAGVIDDGSYDDNKYGYKKYQKRPYDQNSFVKVTDDSDKLNQNNNIGINPNQVNQYTEKVIKNNDGRFPSIGQVISENYDPKIMNQYYNSENLPQSVRDAFKGILDTDDLETGDDIINQMTNNDKNPNGIYVTEKIYSTAPSDVVKNKEQHDEEGYQYYQPQRALINKFPNRFTEIQKEQIYPKEKVTPKPFLTPYVSRNNDDVTQTYGSAEEPGSEIHDTRYYNDSKYPDQRGNVNERYNYNEPSTDNGYIYSEGETNKRPFNPFTGLKSSHSSTNVPTEFPSRLSSTLPSNQYSSGVVQTSKFPYTPESVTEKQNGIPPNYSTARPGFTNEYKTTLPSNYNTYGRLPGKGLNPTSIPDFKPSYAPNIDTTAQPDLSTTEKGFGEDFSGPKQPQSFDPITGYHY